MVLEVLGVVLEWSLQRSEWFWYSSRRDRPKGPGGCSGSPGDGSGVVTVALWMV